MAEREDLTLEDVIAALQEVGLSYEMKAIESTYTSSAL